jgi:hypothetical protein
MNRANVLHGSDETTPAVRIVEIGSCPLRAVVKKLDQQVEHPHGFQGTGRVGWRIVAAPYGGSRHGTSSPVARLCAF